MKRKFLTALLSAVVFSFLLGLLSYLTYTADSLWVPMLFFLMYSAPVYLIGGIPVAFLIDKVINSINFSSQLARHYTRYALFILAGIVISVIYIVILSFADDKFEIMSQASLTYLIGGVIAALVFYYVSAVVDKK